MLNVATSYGYNLGILDYFHNHKLLTLISVSEMVEW